MVLLHVQFRSMKRQYVPTLYSDLMIVNQTWNSIGMIQLFGWRRVSTFYIWWMSGSFTLCCPWVGLIMLWFQSFPPFRFWLAADEIDACCFKKFYCDSIRPRTFVVFKYLACCWNFFYYDWHNVSVGVEDKLFLIRSHSAFDHH